VVLSDLLGSLDPIHRAVENDVHQDEVRTRLVRSDNRRLAGCCRADDQMAEPLQHAFDPGGHDRLVLNEENA
jgi:hypothetical protein